jgi:quercetin dioxygenase-like cupin family protein
MLRGLRNRSPWRLPGGLGALLALAVLAVAPGAVSAQAQQTALARGREELPAGAMLFRISDLTLPPGEPGVTQTHASGFDYAVEGTHVLAVGGAERTAAEGQATWVGPQEEHTHGSLDRAGMRFWFFSFRPAATRGAPPAWPYPGARIRSESEDLQVAAAGPYDLVLSEIHLPSPGAAVGPLARNGPVGVTVVAGEVRLGAQAIPAEGIVVQHPGDSRAFTNSGPGPAHLLALALAPAGATPEQLPRTGGPTPPLRGALAAAAAGFLALGAALRRPRGPAQWRASGPS